MSTQRLQKILAQSGVASRRAAEQLIVDGRVRVNGRIIRELGTRANLLHDRVEVNGRRLVAEKPVYYVLHKPRGVVTTLDDPEGRKTVKDYLRDVPERVFPVGRLDFHTSGVLLLTNDGALAQALLHPRRAVPKTYTAKLEGQLNQSELEVLRAGVVLDDGDKTAPAEVCLVRSDGKHTALEITIAEGKNRQIHRMGEAIGHAVLRLTRVSFAGLTLERLHVGQKRTLTPKELGELKQEYLHGDARGRGHKPRFEAASRYGGGDVEPAHPTVVRAARHAPRPTDGRARRVQSARTADVAGQPQRGRQTYARTQRSTDAKDGPRRQLAARQQRTQRGADTRQTANQRTARTRRSDSARVDLKSAARRNDRPRRDQTNSGLAVTRRHTAKRQVEAPIDQDKKPPRRSKRSR